jgi:hypothetical protein
MDFPRQFPVTPHNKQDEHAQKNEHCQASATFPIRHAAYKASEIGGIP